MELSEEQKLFVKKLLELKEKLGKAQTNLSKAKSNLSEKQKESINSNQKSTVEEIEWLNQEIYACEIKILDYQSQIMNLEKKLGLRK